MAKKRHHFSPLALSPINPSLHFILFLAIAFVLVMIVAVVMQQTSARARANLFCPQSNVDQRALIENLSANCPYGVEYTKDANRCGVWVCKNAPVAY
ncbi:hypothetical protein C4564_01665 [Candidatus Microgenomates bacterium]|nr:MAG: hypothetical protein C4564_01665 [Candidatus Microgenomates bacterium]